MAAINLSALLGKVGGATNALVLLNVAAANLDVLALLWRACPYRILADGAANRLHDACRGAAAEYVPDAIAGDFDSLRADVAEFYRSRGAVLHHEPSQDSHDMVKCLHKVAAARPGANVFVYGAFGGRFDHEAANLNALFIPAWRSSFRQLVLLGPDCAAALVPGPVGVDGEGPAAVATACTRISITSPWEGPLCGVIPLGGAVEAVSTTGLHWDLDGCRTAFGGLVSSSNWISAVYPYEHRMLEGGPGTAGAGPTAVAPAAGSTEAASSPPATGGAVRVHPDAVSIATSGPLVWTVQLHWSALLRGLQCDAPDGAEAP